MECIPLGRECCGCGWDGWDCVPRRRHRISAPWSRALTILTVLLSLSLSFITNSKDNQQTNYPLQYTPANLPEPLAKGELHPVMMASIALCLAVVAQHAKRAENPSLSPPRDKIKAVPPTSHPHVSLSVKPKTARHAFAFAHMPVIPTTSTPCIGFPHLRSHCLPHTHSLSLLSLSLSGRSLEKHKKNPCCIVPEGSLLQQSHDWKCLGARTVRPACVVVFCFSSANQHSKKREYSGFFLF